MAVLVSVASEYDASAEIDMKYRPINAYWTFPPMVTYKCLDEGKVMLGGGVVNSASDFLTTVLPIPIVMRLQMPLKQRVGVCILLCLGLIVTIAGAIRTYYTWKSLMASWDETWYGYPLYIAAIVEIDLGLVRKRSIFGMTFVLTNSQICSCAPAWKSLLQRPITELFSKVSSKLSSLKASSNSPNSSSSGKPGVSNPLRSLPWYQITRFDFQRTRRDPDQISLHDMEKGGDHTVELAVDDHQIGLQQDVGARDFRHSDLVDESIRPATSALHITMRRSFDQRSEHCVEDSPVFPAEWLSVGGSKKSSTGRWPDS